MATVIDKMAYKAGDAFSFDLLRSFFKGDQKDTEIRKQRDIQLATDDNVLIWSEKEKQIIVFPKNALQSSICHCEAENETMLPSSKQAQFEFQTLTCSLPIPFEVVSMKLSFTGQFIALVGLNGVAILEMPRQWGNSSLFVGGKQNVICRTVLVGDQLFRQQINLEVLHLEWFLGSQTDSHIIVLTSDNCLRFYNVGDVQAPLTTINISDPFKTSNSEAALNFAIAYGEVAVSFSIGPPTSDDNGRMVYPIFVLKENGEVVIEWAWLHQKRLFWTQKGPLKMIPEAEDNYGGNFCSILCLAAEPSVVVLATKNGVFYHCLVLDEEKELEIQIVEENFVTKDMVLYVYDRVELERTLIKSDENVTCEPSLNTEIMLSKDTTNASGYFSISSAGAHRMHLPWIADMKDLSQLPNQDFELKSPTELVFLLCTQPAEKSIPYEVLGISSFEDVQYGTVVVCLLEDGEIITRFTNNRSENEINSNHLSEGQSPDASRQYLSPLKRLQYAGNFDEYIRNILKRGASTPLIKSKPGATELSHAEFYQLLTNATNGMREEYIQKLTKASIELKKRCEVLEKHKKQQMSILTEIQERKPFVDKAEGINEKLSAVSANMHSITERLDKVIRYVKWKSPILSDAEQEWNEEVQKMLNSLKNLKRNMAKLKQKNDNFVLGKVRPRKPEESQMNSVQLLKVKSNLKEQNNKVAELVEKVKSIDKQLL